MSSSPALGLKKEAQAAPFPYTDAAVSTLPRSGREADGEQPALSSGRDEQEIQEARREGESRARQAFEEELERVRGNIRTALIKFEKERVTYFQKVETEVVQLALSIARKVLYREAQVDPLLLA